MVDTAPITTAEQLLHAGDIGRCELIRGQLRMLKWSGAIHGRTSFEITYLIATAVERGNLGVVCGANTGVILERNPDTVRAPDAFFHAWASRPPERLEGYIDIPPDLVVEVVDYDETCSEAMQKVVAWLIAGVKLLWVLEPRTCTVHVYQPGGRAQLLDDTHILDGGNILPGFSVPVADLFERN